MKQSAKNPAHEFPKIPVREKILVVEDEEDILEPISYNLGVRIALGIFRDISERRRVEELAHSRPEPPAPPAPAG